MTADGPSSIRHEIVVGAPLERAFAVFVGRFGDFKPRDHNLLAVPIAETVVEPRVGGDIYDRGTDDSVCRWATIVAYEPPHRLVFTWNIGPTWQLEADPARRSEVHVAFSAESATRTRVVLEHRHLDRHGDGWAAVAAGVDGDAGWPLYLARFAGLIES
jgi:uncharacterized protein YndB with AHSA1/START domain